MNVKYDEQFFRRSNPELFDLWTKELKLTPQMNRIYFLGDPDKGDKVLDNGCGIGQLGLRAALIGADVTLSDNSKEALDFAESFAKEHQIRAEYHIADCTRLPFDDETFDVIYFVAMIYHLTPEQSVKALAEIRRTLKPNGKAVITLCGNKFTETLKPLFTLYKKITGGTFYEFDDPKVSGHINKMTPFEFTRLLRQNGFKYKIYAEFAHHKKLTLLQTIVEKTFLRFFFCKGIYAVCWK